MNELDKAIKEQHEKSHALLLETGLLITDMRAEIIIARKENDRIQSENEQLRAAFLKYARHKIDCAWLRGTWDALCTCGYNEAVQQILNADDDGEEEWRK